MILCFHLVEEENQCLFKAPSTKFEAKVHPLDTEPKHGDVIV
jgi:hypothetical protein